MRLVHAFTTLVQPPAGAMTTPTFANFLTLLAGWLVASRRTVTGMRIATGLADGRHHLIFHRFYVHVGHRVCKQVFRPWYSSKSHASFADMFNTLKRVSLREQVFATCLAGRAVEE